jgi:hypothetical protein
MENSPLAPWLRAPFYVAGAFLFSGLLGATLGSVMGYWDTPIAGFCAAFAVVLSSYAAVHRFKLTVSALALGTGALVAYWLLRNSYWPENFPNAYQPTLFPLWCTYGGGIIGFAFCSIARARGIQSTAV